MPSIKHELDAVELDPNITPKKKIKDAQLSGSPARTSPTKVTEDDLNLIKKLRDQGQSWRYSPI